MIAKKNQDRGDQPIQLEKMIESTLLRPEAVKNDIEKLCSQALKYNFYAVCVSPFYVLLASSLLSGSRVKVVTVVGFPFGFNKAMIKAREAEEALKNGATEVDMVINIGALKERESKTLIEEISSVVKTGAVVKVILETGYLDREEIALGATCAVEGGALFVKTSTGFGPRGVTLEDVHLLRSLVPRHIGIKASGGIKTAGFARDLIAAGATRLGTSSAEKIMLEAGKEERIN